MRDKPANPAHPAFTRRGIPPPGQPRPLSASASARRPNSTGRTPVMDDPPRPRRPKDPYIDDPFPPFPLNDPLNDPASDLASDLASGADDTQPATKPAATGANAQQPAAEILSVTTTDAPTDADASGSASAGTPGNVPTDSPTDSPTLPRHRPEERYAMGGDPPTRSVSLPRVFTFPAPPSKNLNDPRDFFRYWEKLRPEELTRAKLYVYRLWPVTDPSQTLTPDELRAIEERRARPPNNYCDTPDPTKPFDSRRWETEMFHRYGSGDYNIKLNDTHPKVNSTVCQTWVRGLRNLSQYPPVLDIDQIVLTDPANASYIRWRQTNNLPMPPGVDNAEDPDSMSTAAVKEMANLVQDQNRQIVEMSKSAQEGKDRLNAEQTNPALKAERTAIDTMAEATRASTTLVADSYRKAQEATATAQDPGKYFERVMDAADRLVSKSPSGASAAPPADPMSGFNAAMETFMKFMSILETKNAALISTLQSQVDRLSTPIRAMATAMPAVDAAGNPIPGQPGTLPAAPIGRQPSMLAQIKEAIEITKMLGGTGGGEDAGAGGLPRWVPLVVAGGSSIVGSVANAIYNARLTAGQNPIPPPAVPDLSAAAAAVGELPEANADSQSQSQSQQEDPIAQIRALLADMRDPIFRALDQGVSGSQFAASFIGFRGAMVYDFLVSQGKPVLIQYLQMDPLLWQEVIKIPQRFELFLDQFLDSRRAHQLARALRNAAAPHQAPAPQAPAPQARGPPDPGPPGPGPPDPGPPGPGPPGPGPPGPGPPGPGPPGPGPPDPGPPDAGQLAHGAHAGRCARAWCAWQA